MREKLRLLANCGVCAAACLAGICSPVALYGQIYSARPYSVHNARYHTFAPFPKVNRAEIYAGPVVSLQPLEDGQNYTVSHLFVGTAAGIRVRVFSSLFLGAEGQYLPQTRPDIPFVSSVRQKAFYFTARWNLTPDTLPPLLLEAGEGQIDTSFKMNLYSGPKERLSGRVFFVGAGSAFALGKGWYAAPSLRWIYMQKTDFDFLLRYASRGGWQTAVFLRKDF